MLVQPDVPSPYRGGLSVIVTMVFYAGSGHFHVFRVAGRKCNDDLDSRAVAAFMFVAQSTLGRKSVHRDTDAVRLIGSLYLRLSVLESA